MTHTTDTALNLGKLRELAEFWAGKYHSALAPVRAGHEQAWSSLVDFVESTIARRAQHIESPSAVGSEQDERALFEAWATGPEWNWTRDGMWRDENGEYGETEVRHEWEVWQARAALSHRAASAPADDKHLPGWERGIATVTLDGHQLRAALEIVNPDGEADPDQLDDWLTFGIVQHRDDDGNESTGMCCWNDDSDGVMPLDGTAGHDPAPASAQPVAAAPAWLTFDGYYDSDENYGKTILDFVRARLEADPDDLAEGDVFYVNAAWVQPQEWRVVRAGNPMEVERVSPPAAAPAAPVAQATFGHISYGTEDEQLRSIQISAAEDNKYDCPGDVRFGEQVAQATTASASIDTPEFRALEADFVKATIELSGKDHHADNAALYAARSALIAHIDSRDHGTSQDAAGNAGELPDNYTVDDSELARRVMVFLGRAANASMEPGADPLRDRLAKKLAEWRATIAGASTKAGGDDAKGGAA